METIIETNNLGKRYRIYSQPFYRLFEWLPTQKTYHKDFWALKHVHLSVKKGSSFGIIGANGAGKSTLLKLLSGITHPTEGSLAVMGTVSSILELGTGFHPDFTGRNNVYLNCALQGYTRDETDALVPGIIEFSELHEFIDLPVRMYSTGMYLRLAFAVATAVDPDILIVDEALSVGDEHFRNKCLDRMNEFKKKGKTILFVSHDLATVRFFCSQVALLDHGTVRAVGRPDEILDQYLEMTHQDKIKQNSSSIQQNGSPRWGAGSIQVERVVMKDRQYRPQSVFDTNQSIVIDAEFVVNRPEQGVVFGYQIFRSDGTYVHGSNHFWHPQRLALDFPQPGRHGVIRCDIPSLPLLPGEYYLTLCCYKDFDGFPQPVDHWERVTTFVVSERSTDQHGIFAMDTHWSLLDSE